MKAISIWQPHASLLMLGLKPFETRGWRFRDPSLGPELPSTRLKRMAI